VCPLAVVHLRSGADDPDATLSEDDIAKYEAEHGDIGRGSAVFLRTDWGGPSADENGTLRFPGFGVDAARTLVEERGVYGLGIDTLGIDPGYASDFPVHREVTLPRSVWHVENLVGLDAVPAAGAWAVVGVPKIGGASGFPVRVLALIPN
jgi:kynurenine formamidase